MLPYQETRFTQDDLQYNVYKKKTWQVKLIILGLVNTLEKKVSRDITYQIIPGGEKLELSAPGRIW